MNFDWSDLAFGSKKPINELKATFIAAPRELSAARFAQLIKEYLPTGNIVLGLAKEPYVLGLEDQPQFAVLQQPTVQGIIDKVNASRSPHKIYTLSYFQRDLTYLLEKLSFTKAVFVRGSWYRAFHLRPEFYALVNRKLAYQLVSPFVDEAEAQQYAKTTKLAALPTQGTFSQQQLFDLASRAATHSYAYSEFQTGVALGKKAGSAYRLIATAHNTVVPYQTYAMHHGAAREVNFSPMNDLNYYDALHAEMQLLAHALHAGTPLAGTTLFINLLPCPMCARMLAQTDIAEFVYQQDHSDGYAIKMFELAGKRVRRITP